MGMIKLNNEEIENMKTELVKSTVPKKEKGFTIKI